MNTHQLVTIVALHLGWRDPSFFHLNTSASMFTNRGKKTISLKSLELEHNYAVTSVTYGSPLSLNSEQLSASSDKPSQASCLKRTPAWNWLLRKQSCTLGLAGERKKRKKKKEEKKLSIHLFIFVFWKTEEKHFATCPVPQEQVGSIESRWPHYRTWWQNSDIWWQRDKAAGRMHWPC